MTTYVELNVAVADAEEAEILTAFLADYPFESFRTERGTLRAYIPQEALADCMEEVEELLDRRGAGPRRYVAIGSEDWNAAWERSFAPVAVGGRLLIRAPHHAPAPAGWTEAIIAPRMAFGTGHHATTRLMAEGLAALPVAGRRGLDLGCGTGVLAILAAKLGAAEVDAVDTDGRAVENCRENADANGVADRVRALSGDIRCVAGRHYDFVLSNICRNVLTAAMPVFGRMLAGGGDLLLSGFLEEDLPIVTEAARAEGFEIAGEHVHDGWAALHGRKERAD